MSKQLGDQHAIDYVDIEGETYVFTDCLSCQLSYADGMEQLGVSSTAGRLPRRSWICKCGHLNEMPYHSDDCPCTMGGPCERADVFNTYPGSGTS